MTGVLLLRKALIALLPESSCLGGGHKCWVKKQLMKSSTFMATGSVEFLGLYPGKPEDVMLVLGEDHDVD